MLAPEPIKSPAAERPIVPAGHSSASFAAVRFVGLLGVLLAAPWCYAAYRIFKYILHLEFVALMSMAMTMNPGQGQPRHRPSPRAAQTQSAEPAPLAARPPAAAPEAHPPLRRINPAVVEPTAHIWVGIMYWIGLLILLAGLTALLFPRRSRGVCRFTAGWVLAGTALTLIAIFVLIRWGGFPPTLRPLAYGLIVLLQSAYAVMLLAAARQARRAA